MELDSFQLFVSELLAGNEVVMTQFVQMVQGPLCTRIRTWITHKALCRSLEPMDVFQELMVKFLKGIRNGKFEIEHPGQLQALLLTMARNEVLGYWKKEHCQKRYCPLTADSSEIFEASLGDRKTELLPTVIHRELWARTWQSMTTEERRVAMLRSSAWSWSQIGEELGVSPEAIRKRFTRSMARIENHLDVVETCNGPD
ncbi:MAG: RNA polymerase sigma factor [Gemmataceae bacterium]